jgi:hypothetical protein
MRADATALHSVLPALVRLPGEEVQSPQPRWQMEFAPHRKRIPVETDCDRTAAAADLSLQQHDFLHLHLCQMI